MAKTLSIRLILPVLFLLAASIPAAAQDSAPDSNSMAQRLSAERVSDVQPGLYDAGAIHFSIQPYGDKFLLRFGDNAENYVLYADRVALGGRVLKYDTGATALKVSVWGGITLYTQDKPDGVPAMRAGDLTAETRAPVSLAELNEAMDDETRHLAYVARCVLHFSADPIVLAANDEAHALAFDTLVNTETGIERLLGNAAARQAVNQHIDSIRIVQGGKPTIRIEGKTLLVSFVPSSGLAGRASSRAIAFALGKLLSIHQPA